MSLKLQKITKSFDDKLIFSNFSYYFPSNGIYAIIGASGAGKTTLLRMISGLDKSFDGKISGGGAKNCSYCFQEYRLFKNLTALENITLASFDKPSESDIVRAKELLAELGFSASDSALYPDELSGGMKQRIAFIRAILKKSPILILDEATKEVDELLASKMLNLIKEEAKSRLVLITTHKVTEIKELGATEIIVGKI